MATTVRSVEYFYATVRDQPGEAASILSLLKETGVQLLAFAIVPTGPTHAQLTIFPEASEHLISATRRADIPIVGPQYAFMVQGDNELGALCECHRLLAEADINVYASNGVTDGRNGFGYILYVRPEDFVRAAQVLGIRASRMPAPPERLAAGPTGVPGPPASPPAPPSSQRR